MCGQDLLTANRFWRSNSRNGRRFGFAAPRRLLIAAREVAELHESFIRVEGAAWNDEDSVGRRPQEKVSLCRLDFSDGAPRRLDLGVAALMSDSLVRQDDADGCSRVEPPQRFVVPQHEQPKAANQKEWHSDGLKSGSRRPGYGADSMDVVITNGAGLAAKSGFEAPMRKSRAKKGLLQQDPFNSR